jgi:hypothetical protein
MPTAHSTYTWRILSILLLAGVCALNADAQKKSAASSAASAAPSAASSSSGAAASNAPVEVEWLSYSALDEILQKVAEYSCDPAQRKFDKVLVLDPPTLQALQAYDSFFAQAESLRVAFNSMAGKSGAGSGIDDFSDITNAVAAAAVATTSETSYNFTIQDPTAAIVLLGKLQKKATPETCKSIYYAGIYSAHDITNSIVDADQHNTAKDNTDNKDTIKDKVENTGTDQDTTAKDETDNDNTSTSNNVPSVTKELKNLAITRRNALLAILGKPNKLACVAAKTPVTGTSNPIVYTVNAQDPCIAAFTSLDGTYNSFLTALSTPNSTTGQPAVSAAIQGYKLRALLQTANANNPALGIYLSVAAAGGTMQDRKNLITAVFTGDWIRYSGGVSVNVILFQVKGDQSKILFSDLLRYRTPLTSIKRPIPHKDFNAGDNLSVFNQ